MSPGLSSATSCYQLPILYALQRAVAALGHCEAPMRIKTV